MKDKKHVLIDEIIVDRINSEYRKTRKNKTNAPGADSLFIKLISKYADKINCESQIIALKNSVNLYRKMDDFFKEKSAGLDEKIFEKDKNTQAFEVMTAPVVAILNATSFCRLDLIEVIKMYNRHCEKLRKRLEEIKSELLILTDGVDNKQ